VAVAAHARRRPVRAFFSGLWDLVAGTTAICFRYRVTGLAAEAAFYALVSLPPLALGLVGGLGLVARHLSPDTVERVENSILDASGRILQDDTVNTVIRPLLDDVTSGKSFSFTIVGLVLTLWSGSRWLNVYVDTITIMYGLNGKRHFLRTRALAFALYLVFIVVGVVLLPTLVIGPDALGDWIPAGRAVIAVAYWPVVVSLLVLALASLYHAAVPVRLPWVRDLPGAGLAIIVWVIGSLGLRWYLSSEVDSSSVYGSLSAPVAVLFWLYLTALAVLIGAGLNAAVDRRFPREETTAARRESYEDPDGASRRS
jgi:membrane protein